MNTQHELTPEQVVVIALAHDHVDTTVRETGALPSLSETLTHVQESYDARVDSIVQAMGASLRTEKAVKGAVGLLALLAKRRTGMSQPL